jgi:hypothetical protein
MPALSGLLVVWQDYRQSCPGCEADIRGKDLVTGQEFIVADGPAHQVVPAIAGRTVAWIEQTSLPDGDTLQRLLTLDLDTRQHTEIARLSGGVTFDRPILSDTYLVWAELRRLGRTLHHRIRAYDRVTKRTAEVGESDYIGTSYALTGRRLLITSPSVSLTDLLTGARRVLDGNRATAPRISGDIAVWVGIDRQFSLDPQIYGIDLRTGQRKPLVVGAGPQQAPALVGDRLVWQRYDGQRTRLFAVSQAEAFAGALVQPAAELPSSPVEPMLTQTTPPSVKGIHTPNGVLRSADTVPIYGRTFSGDGSFTGWMNADSQPCYSQTYGGCTAIDNLLDAAGEPIFGAYVVLSSDLEHNTGRTWPTGNSKVTNAMQHAKNRGARVVVRLVPSQPGYNDQPQPGSQSSCSSYPNTPAYVKNQLYEVRNRSGSGWNNSWIQEWQIHNEPNIEWRETCTGCKWKYAPSGGLPVRCYNLSWYGLKDPMRYSAIGWFYDDVLGELQKAGIPGTFWPPPLADIYGNLDNGANMYDQGNIPNMIVNRYGRVTFHAYPAPNYDLDTNDHIFNNSYPFWPTWLRDLIDRDNSPLPNIITEFGWNPGQMRRFSPGVAPPILPKNCLEWGEVAQFASWPAGGPNGGCGTEDPQPDNPGINATPHAFYDDALHFIRYQRHKAELVAVWILRNGNDWPLDPIDSPTFPGRHRGADRADGIDDYGNLRPWFTQYKAWNGT